MDKENCCECAPPDTGNIINILGYQEIYHIKEREGIFIKVNYERICKEILDRITYPEEKSVQDILRILRELDAEQVKGKDN